MTLAYVRGVAANLPARGYDLLKGADVDRLSAELRAIMPGLIDWSYAFAAGELTIWLPDGAVVPAGLSVFGTVEVIADAR